MFLGVVKFTTGKHPELPRQVNVAFGPAHRLLLSLDDALSLVLAIRDKIKPKAHVPGLKTLIIDVDRHAEEMSALDALKFCKQVCELGKLAVDRTPTVSENDLSTQPPRRPGEPA